MKSVYEIHQKQLGDAHVLPRIVLFLGFSRAPNSFIGSLICIRKCVQSTNRFE